MPSGIEHRNRLIHTISDFNSNSEFAKRRLILGNSVAVLGKVRKEELFSFTLFHNFFYLFATAATSAVVAIDEDPVLLGFLNRLIGKQ